MTQSPANDMPDYKPDPYDCTHYYQRDGEYYIHMPCPPGAHWNEEIWTCDFPENAKCTDLPQP